jgi:predicted TIM-barrel fold metal-dependent hydrolase
VIDADLHNAVPKVEALFPYLEAMWVEYVQQSAFKGPVDTAYPKGAPSSARPEAAPPGGGPAGSDLETLRQQALGAGVEVGVLNCLYAVDAVHNPDSALALARAVNDWQSAEWLEPEPRLRASVVVPSQNPTMAADEIERVGRRAGFVQVLLPARTRVPLGNRRYHPIYRAALDHDLAIGVHFGGAPGNPPTPSGWHALYVEEYVGMAQVMQSQVVSMVAEGLFAELPGLRVALIEGGWSWMPWLMARLDREWRGRGGAPRLGRPPSEVVRERFRLTLTPTHPPARSGLLAEVVEELGSGEMLMYSSDYPHLHAEAPEEILDQLPVATAEGIRHGNARAFYRLGGG